MGEKLPAMIVTGASGMIGRHLIDFLKNNFHIFALARRTQHESRVDPHENISWVLVDISDEEQLTSVFADISSQLPIEYIIHLAAYHEFGNKPHPAYKLTNVAGTKNILELARSMKLQRFLFASSAVACEFPEPGYYVTEQTPPNANYTYTISKREGEVLVREYSQPHGLELS